MSNINERKKELIRSIELRKDIDEIIPMYYKYIVKVMQRDLTNINSNEKIFLAKFIIDYIKEAMKKRYIDDNNIYDSLKRLVETTSSFGVINDGTIYGDCNGYSLRLNFTNSFYKANVKHIIFHELTHGIANLKNQELGEYRKKVNPNSIPKISSKSDIYEQEQTIKIKSRNDIYEPIINGNMITFLNEIIAESTACDLADSYKSLTQVIPSIYSDWVVPYNRSYQYLGYKFLQTLDLYSDSKTDRELFKEITLDAINNKDVCKNIMHIYEIKNPNSWKEDLHEITTYLGNLARTHILNAEDVNRILKLMEKYTKSCFKRIDNEESKYKHTRF